MYGTIIVTAGEITRHNGLLNLYDIVSNFCYRQNAISYRIETFLRVKRLGADRAVFITHETGLNQRPWKTSVVVKKCGAYLDWPGLGKPADSLFFRKRNRPDSRRRTNLPAGHAIQLTAA